MKENKELAKSEAKIQQECVFWYRNTYCLKHHKPRCMIFSIPNEGRGAASLQLMATGLYPGCADLMILHGTAFVFADGEYVTVAVKQLFIECKAEAGVQSDKQKDFEKHCEQIGIPYHIVRSLDEFKQVLKNL